MNNTNLQITVNIKSEDGKYAILPACTLTRARAVKTNAATLSPSYLRFLTERGYEITLLNATREILAAIKRDCGSPVANSSLTLF